MVVMTGQQVIDFIRQHKLKDAEVDIDNMYFTIELPDDTWLEYDIEDEDVKHYPNPDEWQTGPDVISYEEAMNLRFPKKNIQASPRRRMFILPDQGTEHTFVLHFAHLCSEPGKKSNIQKVYRDRFKKKPRLGYSLEENESIVKLFLTPEALKEVLENIEYEEEKITSHTAYRVKSLKFKGRQK